MNVLVETNFVLELVFSRDKFASCATLMEMAEKQQIFLLIPAYSLVEPYEATTRRRKARAQVNDNLTRELKEITRSIPFKERAHQLAELTRLLIQVSEAERHELRNVLSQVLKVASVIELNGAILQESLDLQDQLSMSPQDSVVFASIMSALRQRGGPACFITKNSKDFSVPGIEESLAPYGCSILFDFENGLNFVRNKLEGTKP